MVNSNQRKCVCFFSSIYCLSLYVKDFNEVLVTNTSEYDSVVVTNLTVPIEFVKININ